MARPNVSVLVLRFRLTASSSNLVDFLKCDAEIEGVGRREFILGNERDVKAVRQVHN